MGSSSKEELTRPAQCEGTEWPGAGADGRSVTVGLAPGQLVTPTVAPVLPGLSATPSPVRDPHSQPPAAVSVGAAPCPAGQSPNLGRGPPKVQGWAGWLCAPWAPVPTPEVGIVTPREQTLDLCTGRSLNVTNQKKQSSMDFVILKLNTRFFN